MELKSILASFATLLAVTIPAAAQQPATAPAVPGPPRPGLPDSGTGPVSIVDVMLDHRQELGLSTSQVENLERLDLDVIRDAIRRQADLLIAQVDLGALLDVDPSETIDVAKAEAKMREIERIRTDVQIALVRAVEAAKGQLTPDQRAKLAALTAGDVGAQGDPGSEADVPGEARGTGHPPSGGAMTRPHVPAPHIPARPRIEHPRRFDGRPHAGVFVWPRLWWDPYWAYQAPSAIVPEPPTYLEQPAQAYWYYCPSLRAYYPYVSSCPEAWVPVPVAAQ